LLIYATLLLRMAVRWRQAGGDVRTPSLPG